MKMDSPYFFYNREHIEDSQPENRMTARGKLIILDEETMIDPALAQAILGIKAGKLVMLGGAAIKAEEIESMMTKFKEEMESGQTFEVIYLDHFAILGAGAGRSMSKSFLTDQIIRERMMDMESTEDWYQDSKYNNWKDFIQNPARPGRQIRKQKPPKQSFKAQMRSVNRNR